MDPSQPPLATSAACCGVGRGVGAGRGQKAGPQRKEVPLARGPGRGTKLLMLFSGKQGLTVPDEPSPAESRLGTSTDGHWEHKTLVCFHCASGCCLLGPSRSQDCSQDSVESRGQGEEEPVPLGRGAFWQPQLRRRRPWTSVREG